MWQTSHVTFSLLNRFKTVSSELTALCDDAPCYTDSMPMTTMSNGNSGTSYRSTEPVIVNGGTTEHDDDDDWLGGYDVKSLLEDAPVDSIRQRMHVEREESMVDSQTPDVNEDAPVRETVDLDFVDGQVYKHTNTQTNTGENWRAVAQKRQYLRNV